jgi:hypothetical protein
MCFFKFFLVIVRPFHRSLIAVCGVDYRENGQKNVRANNYHHGRSTHIQVCGCIVFASVAMDNVTVTINQRVCGCDGFLAN